jgi:hypothetical protein
MIDVKKIRRRKAQESQALQWQKARMSDLAPEYTGKRERMDDGK